jgi:hypothetical protein
MTTPTTRTVLKIVMVMYLLFLVVHIVRIPAAQTPPLEPIFREIQREFYVEYLSTGKVPTDLSFLSSRATRLMKIYSDSFTWNPSTGSFNYTFEKPYPLNKGSIVNILTLGLIDPEPKITGIGISAETITNNAPLYKALGEL